MLRKNEINEVTGKPWFAASIVEPESEHLVKDFTGAILFKSEVL